MRVAGARKRKHDMGLVERLLRKPALCLEIGGAADRLLAKGKPAKQMLGGGGESLGIDIARRGDHHSRSPVVPLPPSDHLAAAHTLDQGLGAENRSAERVRAE